MDAITTDSDDASSSAGEESDSDWEPTQMKKTRNTYPPAKKRARLSVTYNTRSRNKPKPFSMLFSMPMDILFEMLGHLSPEDLVMLTRTSKVLRRTLFTRNSITIWKAARESIGAPEPFPDFSEQVWAWLLFGSTNFKCHRCGRTGTEEIDFMLRRRVCTPCKKAKLVLESKVPGRFPHLEAGTLDLIPYSRGWSWHHSTSKFYWVSDIVDMAHRLGELRKAIHRRIPGAKRRMDDLCSEQIELVDVVLEEAKYCNDWFNNYIKTRRTDRYRAIVARFVKLGYDEEDVKPIKHTVEYGWQDLTDRAWKRIHPALEPLIQETRARRLPHARADAIKCRIAIVNSLYHRYLQTLLPSQWALQPCVADVCQFSPFDTLVQAPNHVIVDFTSFAEAVTMLPGLISTWTQNKQRRLLDMLPVPASSNLTVSCNDLFSPTVSWHSARTVAQSSPTRNTTTSCGSTSTIDRLSLATSVFKRRSSVCEGEISLWQGQDWSKALIAWDVIHAHQCRENVIVFPGELCLQAILLAYEFSHEGSAAASTLISLAGLDVSSATPLEMDQRDLRFFCRTCGPESCHGGHERQLYTWRTAIHHSLEAKHVPDWVVLTKQEEATISFLEVVYPIKRWTCNHCTTYPNSWVSLQNIVGHLRNVHNIVDWETPRDLFHVPYKRCSSIPLHLFRVPRPGEVRCKHCPISKRGFDSRGVKKHLEARHDVINPVEDVDWAEFKLPH